MKSLKRNYLLFTAPFLFFALSSLSAERTRDAVDLPPLISISIPDSEAIEPVLVVEEAVDSMEANINTEIAFDSPFLEILPTSEQESAPTALPFEASSSVEETTSVASAPENIETPLTTPIVAPVESIVAPTPALQPQIVVNDTAVSEPNAIPLDLKEEESSTVQVSLQQVFRGSPTIYTLLLLMSIGAVCIWLYITLSLREAAVLPEALIKNLRNKLYSNQYEEALALCLEKENFFCKMLASGIETRRYGLPVMIEAMKAEGKRATASFWQRTSLLNDIAVIAPMIGLLGTVLGMFYAFYDMNRSMDTVSTLFDGLGISVGTTVAGLLVAILAMILQSLTKYRLVKLFTNIENEIQSFATMIDNHLTVVNK